MKKETALVIGPRRARTASRPSGELALRSPASSHFGGIELDLHRTRSSGGEHASPAAMRAARIPRSRDP